MELYFLFFWIVNLVSCLHFVHGEDYLNEKEKDKIYFKSGEVVDTSIPTNFVNSLKNKRDSIDQNESFQIIVSLHSGHLIEPILKVCSAKSSISLSAGSYSLLCPLNQIIAVESHPSVRWVGNYENSMKANILSKRSENVGDEYENYDIFWAEEISKEDTRSVLEGILTQYSIDFKITETYLRYSVVSVHQRDVNTFLEAVIQLKIVHRIEKRYPIKPFNSKAKAITQTGTLTASLNTLGLNGDGIVIGISDTGIDTNHCYFYDPSFPVNHCNENSTIEACLLTNGHRKIVGYYDHADSTDGDGHGTHVAGTASGKAFLNSNTTMNLNQGIAPNSKIAFFDVGLRDEPYLTIPSMSELLLPYLAEKGSSVSSHSWGSSSTAYSTTAYFTDVFSYANPDHLVLIAAGNYGPSARTVSGTSISKNGISVGSAPNNVSPSISGFSSRGPTSDNRIKPDFVTPGEGILSSRVGTEAQGRNCNNPAQQLTLLSGTSMATPNAAGAAALVYQYYKQGFICGKNVTKCGFNPSSALVKATLINSAQHFTVFDDPVLNIGATGFGRLQLNDTLDFTGKKLIYFDRKKLRSFQNFTTTVTPKGKGSSLNVVLVWTDPPGSMSTGKVLINDLDLIVISPSGSRSYGNVYLGLPYITERDTMNNAERVVIQFLENGPYQIVVRANNLNSFYQSFSLVINLESNVKYSNIKINRVRLADGKSPKEGRLELLVGSAWMKACKSQVTVSAKTVCENFLGFPRSNKHFMYSYPVHPIGNTSFFPGTFSCLGNEVDPKQCSASSSSCSLPEIVGINCDCPEGYTWNGYTCTFLSSCQTISYENRTWVNIADLTWSNISVQVPNLMYEKISVQTFIEHTYTSDLGIFLTHPSGSVIMSYQNGGSTDNVFNGTIWSNSFTNSLSTISFVSGKVIESVRPQATFPDAPNTVPSLGEWSLAIYDYAMADSGKSKGFILTFAYNCVHLPPFFDCTPGFFGPNCTMDFNECGLDPCPSYLSCVNTIGSYRCENKFNSLIQSYSPSFFYTFDTSSIMDSSGKLNHLQNSNLGNTLVAFPSSRNPSNRAVNLTITPAVTNTICHGKGFTFMTSFYSKQTVMSQRLVSLSKIYPNGTETSLVSLTFSGDNVSGINLLSQSNLGKTSNLFPLNTNYHLMFVYSQATSRAFILVNGNLTLNVTVPALLKSGDCFQVSIGRGMTNTLIDYASFHPYSLLSNAQRIFADYALYN